MRDHYEALRDLGAEVVAISTEPAEVARAESKAARLPFPVISDVTLATIDAFGLRHLDEPKGRDISRPATLILDRERTVRYAYIGEHARDRPAIGVILLALESMI
ncbi:MAG: peroxiredoxin family protein [Chloroflexota bacterium]|nr:peroxiredoxin family protein [Chloroflexota bacterium]